MGLIVDITTRCNMTCAHCMWSRTAQGEDMTEEVFVATLKMEPVRGRGTLSFGSGEPTIHPLFWRFIELALADGRWGVRVVTNGKKKRTSLRLAELAKEGKLQAHLSLDEWHDPISPEVIEAFKRDPSLPNDKRGYREMVQEDLKNVGRCDFGPDQAPSCRCPVPKVRPDGSVYLCGCEEAKPIGHVLTGWDKGLVKKPSALGCSAYSAGADNKAGQKRFYEGLHQIMVKGRTR